LNNNDIRWIQRFRNFTKAVLRLTKYVEKMNLNELEEQGLIQAFEYTHELAWNTIKDFLESRGDKEIYGSKDATREAFRLGLIENGEIWMNMIVSRNLTSHTYNEETAKEIVDNIQKKYHAEFITLQKKFLSLQEIEPV